MSSNITAVLSDIPGGLYIVVVGYSLSTILSTCICIIIIGLISITRNLRSPTNLLISNTCLCTLFFSTIATCNTILYYINWLTTDWSCRVQGYLTYVSICLVVYSYVIQTISRLSLTVFYQYRCLLTLKFHTYMILVQILFSFLFPLSTLITTHIVYRPFRLCLVPSQYKIHTFSLIGIVYIVPILIVCVLYIIIYRHTRNSSQKVHRSTKISKRDAELARNIIILFAIFIFSGVPASLYTIISTSTPTMSTGFYFFSIMTPPISLVIEKIVTIILSREIRNTFKQRWITCLSVSTRVEHFSSSNAKNNNKMNLTDKQ
ncbi:hypothetical protein I4U23_028176 [Adineta vaga]|nr:hypothetical protein I4U23_028176 [Adineta vaga]